MKSVYIIQEYFDDVFCDKVHECNGKKKKCGKQIRCARIIQAVTNDKLFAISVTKDKPNMSYEKFELI